MKHGRGCVFCFASHLGIRTLNITPEEGYKRFSDRKNYNRCHRNHARRQEIKVLRYHEKTKQNKALFAAVLQSQAAGQE